VFRCRLAWLTALLCTPLLPVEGVRANEGLKVPLECQLDQGGWQPCTLTIEQLGEHWWLQIGAQRLDFRSDGRGSITLIEGGASPRAVQPMWTAQRALCWDGVCTKGDLPLD
jgi:hypothetical protein